MRGRRLERYLLFLIILTGCGGATLAGRPTVEPLLVVTPAPTQNIGATATAYARGSLPTPTPSGVYIVRAGDTLSKIADNFETTVEELLAANNLSDPDRIQVGQELRLPYTGTSPASTPLATLTASP